MAVGVFDHVKISAISAALPVHSYDTNELAGRVMDERALKRFIKSTGVKSRYLARRGQTTSDLCYVAAEKLLSSKEIDRKEIDACIFISQTPDYKVPSTAIVLQERLGLNTECMSFDINLGCSGYVYGICMLASLIVT